MRKNKECVYKMHLFVLYHTNNMSTAEVQTDYAKQTCAALKEVLQERSLPVSGNKAELVARLIEDDEGGSERKKWSTATGPAKPIPQKPFEEEKVGPKNIPPTLTSSSTFLLFWNSLLEPLAKSINDNLPNIKVNKYLLLLL